MMFPDFELHFENEIEVLFCCYSKISKFEYISKNDQNNLKLCR